MLALTWAVYYPGLGGPLLLDDIPQLQGLMERADSDAGDLLASYTKSTSGPLGRQVSMVTFIADAVLHGNDTWWWKHTNLLIHLACGLLVFAFVRLLYGLARPAPAVSASLAGAVIAGAWLLHPLQVSTVLYTVQRMTELSTLFVLAGLFCYGLGRRELDRSASRGWMLIATAFLVFYPLGIFSKENAVLFPAYCTLLEMTVFRPRGDSAASRQVRALHAVLVVGYLAFAGLVLANVSNVVLDSYAYRDFSPTERVLTQFRVIVSYLLQILLPLPGRMGFFHDDVAVSTGLFSPVTTFASILVIGGLVGSAITGVRRLPLYAFGILFYFATHLIESSLLGLELMFEHRNYLGLMGILLALGQIVAIAVTRRRVAAAAAAGLIAVYAALTAGRADTWSSPGELYVAAFEAHPQSPRVNLMLANTAAESGDYALARQHLDRTGGGYGPYLHRLLIDCLEHGVIGQEDIEDVHRIEHGVVEAHTTSSASMLVDAAANGRCELNAHALLDAIDALLAGRIRSDRDHQHLLIAKARLLELSGDIDAAVATYDRAQSATPDDSFPTYAAADTLIRHEAYPAALDMLARADAIDAVGTIHRDTTAAAIYSGFGALLESLGRPDAAADAYRQAVRRFPARADFYLKAAAALSSVQRVPEARSLLRQMQAAGVSLATEQEAEYRQLAAALGELEGAP